MRAFSLAVGDAVLFANHANKRLQTLTHIAFRYIVR